MQRHVVLLLTLGVVLLLVGIGSTWWKRPGTSRKVVNVKIFEYLDANSGSNHSSTEAGVGENEDNVGNSVQGDEEGQEDGDGSGEQQNEGEAAGIGEDNNADENTEEQGENDVDAGADESTEQEEEENSDGEAAEQEGDDNVDESTGQGEDNIDSSTEQEENNVDASTEQGEENKSVEHDSGADEAPRSEFWDSILTKLPTAAEIAKAEENEKKGFGPVVHLHIPSDHHEAPLSTNQHRLVQGTPTFQSPLDRRGVKNTEIPELPDDFVLPSQRSVAENMQHHETLCKQLLRHRFEENVPYIMWKDGFSQFGQDRYLWDEVFARRHNGIFVDIGAYDGETHSNSAVLEYCFGWTGILIEANPDMIQQIKLWRKNVILYQAACSTKDERCEFLVKSAAEHSGLIGHGARPLIAEPGDKKIHIPCVRLDHLFQRHNVTHINYLSIDTSGTEMYALESINYDKVQIDVIGMVNNNRQAMIANFLSEKGFQYKRALGEDLLFYRNTFTPVPYRGN